MKLPIASTTITTSVTLLLLVLTILASGSNASSHPKTARAQVYVPSLQQYEMRDALDDLPSTGSDMESQLQYMEAVIHALEGELPRKSIFRSLFIDKARLSTGYDKHFRFSYSNVLKNTPGQDF